MTYEWNAERSKDLTLVSYAAKQKQQPEFQGLFTWHGPNSHRLQIYKNMSVVEIKLTMQKTIVFEASAAKEGVKRVHSLFSRHWCGIWTIDVGRALGRRVGISPLGQFYVPAEKAVTRVMLCCQYLLLPQLLRVAFVGKLRRNRLKNCESGKIQSLFLLVVVFFLVFVFLF